MRPIDRMKLYLGEPSIKKAIYSEETGGQEIILHVWLRQPSGPSITVCHKEALIPGAYILCCV